MATQRNLDVTLYDIDELQLYDHNSKLHTQAQIDMIAKSIEDFGYLDPIAVWHDGDGNPVVVEGEGRILACKRLGIDKVPAICIDGLSDEERRMYSHVHNITTLATEVDMDIVAVDVTELGDVVDFEAYVPDLPSAQELVPIDAEERETDDVTDCKVTVDGHAFYIARDEGEILVQAFRDWADDNGTTYGMIRSILG